MSVLYEKMLDTFLILRDVSQIFKTYSATDIKQLIKSKLQSKREPRALQQLYMLEEAIRDLRLTLAAAKEKADEEEREKEKETPYVIGS